MDRRTAGAVVIDNVLLVDGNNIAMRALHAAKRQMEHDGMNTGPVVIFINMLSRAVKHTEADRILVAFDSPTSTLARRAVLPEYKANRKPSTPEEQRRKDDVFRLVRELLDVLGVPHTDIYALEADDIIASAWRAEVDRGSNVWVLSGDKDLLQLLVEPRTCVLRPTTNGLEEWEARMVEEDFGVTPERLPYYLALVGDVADNVSGVRGIGPKKAMKMLSERDFAFDIVVAGLDEERRHQAEVSYVVVDLIGAQLIAPGEIVPQTFPRTPEMTPALDAFLDTYALVRLRHSIVDGTLWEDRQDGSQDDLTAHL